MVFHKPFSILEHIRLTTCASNTLYYIYTFYWHQKSSHSKCFALSARKQFFFITKKEKQKGNNIINDVGQVDNIWLKSKVLNELNFSLDLKCNGKELYVAETLYLRLSV